MKINENNNTELLNNLEKELKKQDWNYSKYPITDDRNIKGVKQWKNIKKILEELKKSNIDYGKIAKVWLNNTPEKYHQFISKSLYDDPKFIENNPDVLLNEKPKDEKPKDEKPKDEKPNKKKNIANKLSNLMLNSDPKTIILGFDDYFYNVKESLNENHILFIKDNNITSEDESGNYDVFKFKDKKNNNYEFVLDPKDKLKYDNILNKLDLNLSTEDLIEYLKDNDIELYKNNQLISGKTKESDVVKNTIQKEPEFEVVNKKVPEEIKIESPENKKVETDIKKSETENKEREKLNRKEIEELLRHGTKRDIIKSFEIFLKEKYKK